MPPRHNIPKATRQIAFGVEVTDTRTIDNESVMHYRKPKVSIQESSAAGYESDNSRIDQVRVPSSMESMTNRSLSVAQ